MFRRKLVICVSLFLSLVPGVAAKNSKKQLLQDEVLHAQTVAVIIRPGAGEPVANPLTNRTAQEDVEKAIMTWGRLHVVTSTQNADLIIAVRKGSKPGPVISHSPADDRSIIYQPTEGGGRIGAQRGSPPDLTGNSGSRRAQVEGEIGSLEDTFEVYRGGQDPLDSPAIWRYRAKDALTPPRVPAVEQFRKAIEESEKQRHKP
ncbi:MAG: hypothetical protein M3O09_06640 [Acidobacteriota bacterium]|nr:hypothetical protein [Acidobacteriota bacterium]